MVSEKFHGGDFGGGAVTGVQGVGALLATHFPAASDRGDSNELANAPVVL